MKYKIANNAVLWLIWYIKCIILFPTTNNSLNYKYMYTAKSIILMHHIKDMVYDFDYAQVLLCVEHSAVKKENRILFNNIKC